MIYSLSRRIWFAAEKFGDSIWLKTILQESGSDHCVYMVHSGPSVLLVQFMTGNINNCQHEHLINVCCNAAITMFLSFQCLAIHLHVSL